LTLGASPSLVISAGVSIKSPSNSILVNLNLFIFMIVFVCQAIGGTINKKAEPTEGIILRQLGRLSLLRPVAFRPLLAKSLALSRII
jgi:hypothetical protein